MHQRLLDELDRRNLLGASEETLTTFVQTFVDEALRDEDLPLNEAERRRLVGDLLEETLGVGPLASLMADPAVTDILVNSPQQVYVERFGRLEKTDVRFRDADHLVRIIQRIAARVGRRIDESSPMVDARLPDGSRVNATLPPVTIDAPTLSIRRFGRQRLRRSDLMQLGMFSSDIHTFLDAVVRGRKNLLISGGTGSGKSTLLGALAEAIPDRERIVTVEDSAELILDQEHVVRMETRPPNIEGRGLITARDLVVNALRMRPDRIIVGEVRSGEALDMLQAMNTGHDGGMTTVHANSPRDALARLETMVLMAGLELPSRAIREQIVSALHLIVHVRRFEDGVRRVESIAEIVGMEGTTPQLQDIFRFERRGQKGRQIAGEFVATGIVPRVVEELQERGIEIPRTLFQKSKSAVHDVRFCYFPGCCCLGLASSPPFGGTREAARSPGDAWRIRPRSPAQSQPEPIPAARSFLVRHRFLPWMVGLLAAGFLYFALGWAPPFVIAVGLIVSLLAGQLESYLAVRRTARIETQLADAIDLMVAALGAGAGVTDALENAMGESRRPLRPQLEEVVGRIRFGDDPRTVYHGLTQRVPLETFLLFSSALSVQSETGGSLAPNLGERRQDDSRPHRDCQAHPLQLGPVRGFHAGRDDADVLHRAGGVAHQSRANEPVPCHVDRPMGGRGNHPSASSRPGLDVVPQPAAILRQAR